MVVSNAATGSGTDPRDAILNDFTSNVKNVVPADTNASKKKDILDPEELTWHVNPDYAKKQKERESVERENPNASVEDEIDDGLLIGGASSNIVSKSNAVQEESTCSPADLGIGNVSRNATDDVFDQEPSTSGSRRSDKDGGASGSKSLWSKLTRKDKEGREGKEKKSSKKKPSSNIQGDTYACHKQSTPDAGDWCADFDEVKKESRPVLEDIEKVQVEEKNKEKLLSRAKM